MAEPCFTWGHFKWFLAFISPIAIGALTGLVFFGSYALNAHEQQGTHKRSVRKETYTTDLAYLKRDLEHIGLSLGVLTSQVGALADSQRQAREEILKTIAEVKASQR